MISAEKIQNLSKNLFLLYGKGTSEEVPTL